MEINIKDYLSEDEVEKIVVEEIRTSIKRILTESETTRIIGNASYFCAHDIIDNCISVEQQLDIVKKTNEILEDMSSYSVFRYHYLSKKPESLAAKIIDKTVKNNEEKIISMVNKKIEQKLNADTYENFVERMMDNMYNGFKISFERNEK